MSRSQNKSRTAKVTALVQQDFARRVKLAAIAFDKPVSRIVEAALIEWLDANQPEVDRLFAECDQLIEMARKTTRDRANAEAAMKGESTS